MSQGLIQMLGGARQAQGAKAALDPATLHFLTRLSADSKASDFNWRLGRPAPGMFEGIDAPSGDDISGMVAATGAPRRMMEQGAWEQAISRIPPPDNMYNNAFARQKRDAKLLRMDPSEQSQSLEFINLLDRQRGSQSIMDSIQSQAQRRAEAEEARRAFVEYLRSQSGVSAPFAMGAAIAGGLGAQAIDQYGEMAGQAPGDISSLDARLYEDPASFMPELGMDIGSDLPVPEMPEVDDGSSDVYAALAEGSYPPDENLLRRIMSAISGAMTPEEAIGPLSDGPDQEVVGGLEDEEHPDWPRVRELIRSGLSEQDAWNAVAGGM